ncbi:hypothetical protein FISHEDRAFT_37518 [Fistulina hepatica ATCC 64428]|uniref:ARM repeat-containing protein n=1 Tax=Fistulina hepatica ATCC 64428 TaxID=1128425 RepID=A0A0D7AKR7_9AGAR|nr:hypothetical protein FISHEDRAFT_37518 [Fistulina hepatica ATCC 64428]
MVDDARTAGRATPGDDYDERYLTKFKTYIQYLPYGVEPSSKMMEMLDWICLRISQCVQARDFDVGLVQFDSMLSYWRLLKHPIPKDRRIKLAKIYYHVCVTPGTSNSVIAMCAETFVNLTRSRKKLSIDDMQLPWKPVYEILEHDLFLKRRRFEYTGLSFYMGYLAENARWFYGASDIDAMLATFLPQMNGTNLDSILAAQYYFVTFLPLNHPQSYLPVAFRIWESINSYMFDDRMLQFLASLSEMHVVAEVSDPGKVEVPQSMPRPQWSRDDLYLWSGLYKDVGIFSEHEWSIIMCKCLASMEIPLTDAGSLTTSPNTDLAAGFELGRLPKVTWRIKSLARIIVWSMATDGIPAPASNMPTPLMTPSASGTSTPQIQTSTLKEFLSAPLGRGIHKVKTYIAGSRALDSLARLIFSLENFFHPHHAGSWSTDLTAFIKFIVYEFNMRWHDEQRPECKTPMIRRLTRSMKRELVKCLRTVALLALFSPQDAAVANVTACLKSMSVMEPDLILQPILDRAIPALEALEERTTAMIKALGAVVPALVSRQIYYPGARHLVLILQLLIPGIDLNDPGKTNCTVGFLMDIFSSIKIGDLRTGDNAMPQAMDTELAIPEDRSLQMPFIDLEDFDPRLSDEEEDALLKESTGDFADWVANFIRRVIQLLENLPEENDHGSGEGTVETQLVYAVIGACSQICIHLSEPLYDLVLNLIFDYASNNVRPNAVRAIHQLVECVANASPEKTLAKFVPFCARNIRVEIENGASSVRTTSSSTPLPSDATLHWNLAILRGTVYNDGKKLLKYREEFLSLLKLLHHRAFSKRGFSWTGRLLSSMLLTLTHTYPLENRFVNPDEWNSEEFQWNHHKYWGKLYRPDEIKINWHVPNADEIEFALEIFTEIVEPAIMALSTLIETDHRDAVWRNDFCRHLSLVRSAFSGIPTLLKLPSVDEKIMREQLSTSDVLFEIPEMIGVLEPLASGFCLDDSSDSRYQYLISVRRQFGELLHKASVSLTQQGEENTVDAVYMLVRSIRTFFLDYGDSRDRRVFFHVNSEQFEAEKNVARHYGRQKVWPRSVLVRRARFYHSARLIWNCIDRLRGDLEHRLWDDLAEWSMWHYAIIRESSQELLDSIARCYDGLRRHVLPILYRALDVKTEDDRLKGALHTLNYASFGKYAVGEPTLASEFIVRLFGCQHSEKPSIQQCIAMVSENCLSSFVEPCYLSNDVLSSELNTVAIELEEDSKIKGHCDVVDVVERCRQQVIKRFELYHEASVRTTSAVLEIAQSSHTHWKYLIIAVRCLRTLVRRDVPLTERQTRFFLDNIYHSNPSVYSQRALTKTASNIKLRTLCSTPADLAMCRYRSPLKRSVPVQPSQALRRTCKSFIFQGISDSEHFRSIFVDKDPPGWLVWPALIDVIAMPDTVKSTFLPWDPTSAGALDELRKVATTTAFWNNLAVYYAEEGTDSSIVQDDVSCVKSIFQLLEDEPFEALRPTLESLLHDKDRNKQRAAAEFMAGLLGGSKHWPTTKQDVLWEWLAPQISTILASGVQTDTVSVWTSFLEYVLFKKDPRRVQSLVEYLFEQFYSADYNGEMSIEAMKVLSFFQAMYEELGVKFSAWSDQALDRCWLDLSSDHDDIRAYFAEFLAFSIPSVQVFVKECRVLPPDYDIMGMRGTYHRHRIAELVKNFPIWYTQRFDGVRAPQSTYDRVGIVVCKWLFKSIHDITAISSFDYLLPLMPELFRFTEVSDNNELATRATTLLVRMCGVMPPQSLVNPILDAIFEAIRSAASWRIRLKAIPLVQVFYFRNVPLISDAKIVEILEVLCKVLDDEIVEVREKAALTLSGVLRLSPRRSVLTLKDRFVRLARNSHIPPRHDPDYSKAIRQRHAAILGICALIDSFPYTVEKWMPELMANVLVEYTYDPIPISTTVRKCARNFKKTHQDTWHEDSKRFNEDQSVALSTLLTGSSYCKQHFNRTCCPHCDRSSRCLKDM